jgi:DNA-binding MarR family transcriptional regulator
MKKQQILSQQVCFPIYAFAKEIINQYRPLLDAIDLTYPQYLVMLVLWEFESQTVNQLGEKLKLDSGTLTPLLKRMEAKLLVTRTRSSSDERVVNIALTQNGKALQIKAANIPAQLIEAMNVTLEELEELKNIISKISNKNNKNNKQ